MTKYSKIFLNHRDYSRLVISDPGKYLSFCEDVRDVHYDIVSPIQTGFTISSNKSWYLPGYDYEDPRKLPILTPAQPIVRPQGEDLEMDLVINSGDGVSSLTVLDNINHVELGKALNIFGKISIVEPDTSKCDMTFLEVIKNGFVVQGVKRINLKLLNISTDIAITFS